MAPSDAAAAVAPAEKLTGGTCVTTSGPRGIAVLRPDGVADSVDTAVFKRILLAVRPVKPCDTPKSTLAISTAAMLSVSAEVVPKSTKLMVYSPRLAVFSTN